MYAGNRKRTWTPFPARRSCGVAMTQQGIFQSDPARRSPQRAIRPVFNRRYSSDLRVVGSGNSGARTVWRKLLRSRRPVLSKVRHMSARRPSYYVVSGYEHFHLPLSRPTSGVDLAGRPGGCLGGRIEEMAEMPNLLGCRDRFVERAHLVPRPTVLARRSCRCRSARFLTAGNCTVWKRESGIAGRPRAILWGLRGTKGRV